MIKQFTTLVMVLLALSSFSQELAVEHMKFFTTREQELSKKYMDYISQVAHGNRARKMEKRRQEVIAEIRQSLNEATRLRPYKGDASLRDAYKTYWDILLKVFNEDYHKIVNMEEIAEQSYDQMEAYLLAQEKAGEVLSDAQDDIEPVFNAFASKNNIRLVSNGESKLDKQMRQVGLVNSYYHQLYLIFFKTYKQEAYVMEALNRKDVNGLEQNRTTLLKYAEEGLQKVDTMKAFKGDGSLVTACRKVLEFQKLEAANQLAGIGDFLLKNDEFEKVKKAFDSKPASKRTQADIDLYNKAVDEFNNAVQASNKLLAGMNGGRDKVMTNWDVTRKRFLEMHVPKSR
ncbi:MAG TPA: hypothetical protein VF490_09325 [Chryseosolibacter sp.]